MNQVYINFKFFMQVHCCVLSRVHGAVLSSGASEANHQVRKSTFQETLHVGIHQSVGIDEGIL